MTADQPATEWDDPALYQRAKVAQMNGHRKGVLDCIAKMSDADKLRFGRILLQALDLSQPR